MCPGIVSWLMHLFMFGGIPLHDKTPHRLKGQAMQERQWCSDNIQASHACAPGSTPGWRIFFSAINGVMVRFCFCASCFFLYFPEKKTTMDRVLQTKVRGKTHLISLLRVLNSTCKQPIYFYGWQSSELSGSRTRKSECKK